MRIIIGSIAALFLFALTTFAQGKCLQAAGEIQPKLSAEQRRDFEIKLTTARADFQKEPSADNSIWLGRRTAYLGRYKESIAIFTDAIIKYPKDARLYRHRGHRSEEHTSELQSPCKLVCRLLLEKKQKKK